jgi:dTMP kinase
MTADTEPNTRPGATPQGALVSIEGLNGVGKTYLTGRLLAALPPDQRPTVVEEFSRRHTITDPGGALGRHLLRALVGAADGDPFLRGGLPRSETLLLLAIKIHDYEASLPALRSGRTVIEGRSVHSVAVYQSLILEHDNIRAAAVARQILTTATMLRPLPDLTVLVVDEPTTAVHRAENRDGTTYTPEQWHLHHRAAELFDHVARTDPGHVRILDRREHDTDALVDTLRRWTADPPRRAWTGPC